MPKLKLTKTAINAIQLPEAGKRTNYFDTEVTSLVLRVTSTGAKTYYLLHCSDGKRDWLKLGKYPDLTPEQARQAAQKALGVYASGVNPAEAKRTIKGIPTLAEFFYEQYMPNHGNAKRSSKNDVQRFRKWIKPRLGSKKLTEIESPDIAAVIRAAQNAGLAVSTVKQVKALASVILSKAAEWGHIADNPARNTKVPGRAVKRDRFLLPHEMQAFFKSVEEEAPQMRDIILLALLTGARRGNVLAMRWDELDLEQAVWRIPRTKDGTPQTVTLAPEAVGILEQRKFQSTSDFVFPANSKTGHTQEPQNGLKRVLKRAGIPYGRDVPNGVVFHDLRRSLGSWQARIGSSLVVIGKSLNHKCPSTTAIYAMVDQDPVRKSVNTAVSAMLEAAGITEPAQVVPIKRP